MVIRKAETHPSYKYNWKRICELYYQHKYTTRKIMDEFGMPGEETALYNILKRDYAIEWALEQGHVPYHMRQLRDDVSMAMICHYHFGKHYQLDQINKITGYDLTPTEFEVLMRSRKAKSWRRMHGYDPERLYLS